MGSAGNRSNRGRGRSWRRVAGAASFRLGDPVEGVSHAATREADGEGTALREPWSLKTAATLRPGQKGTKQFVAE